MRYAYVAGSLLAVAVLVGTSPAKDDLQSGPQKASIKVRAFNPLHCSGSTTGTKGCLV